MTFTEISEIPNAVFSCDVYPNSKFLTLDDGNVIAYTEIFNNGVFITSKVSVVYYNDYIGCDFTKKSDVASLTFGA